MGKLLLLTLNEQEETAIDKIISAISDYIQIEPMQITTNAGYFKTGRK